MNLQVLIIDDYPAHVKAVSEVIKAHSLTCTAAGDMATARKHLATGTFGFCILDLSIPAESGETARRENGRLLLRWMRKNAATATMPVIIVTGEDNGDTEFAVSVVSTGNSEFTGYLKKPVISERLDEKISWAMALCGQVSVIPPAALRDQPREMVVHEDHILFLGAEVWRDSGVDTSVRNACAILSKKDRHGFVRMKGTALGKQLSRDNTNHISTPLNRMLDRCCQVAKEKGIACQRTDLIDSRKGGYHFCEWMQVTVVGDWAGEFGVEGGANPTQEPAAASTPDPLADFNDRQRWILERLDAGDELRIQDIVKHTKKDRSTVNRDLKALRDAQVIATHPDGHITRTEPRRDQASRSRSP